MQNVSFCDPSNTFPIILHGDFTDFRERVAQKLLYAVVYWSFSSTFLDIRAKWPKIPTYLLSYLVLFELRWSSSPQAQNTHICCHILGIFGYEIPIFPSQNPYENMHEMRGFRAWGPFRAKMGQMGQKAPNMTTNMYVSDPPFSNFSGRHVEKPT